MMDATTTISADIELIESATAALQISNVVQAETTEKLSQSSSHDDASASASSTNIKIHQFGTQVLDTTYFFQVTNFGSSIYLWVGDGAGKMDDLAMSSVTPYDKKGMSTTTKLIGRSGDNLSESFAGRLTKRLKKPVYVSFNVDVGALYTTILQDIEQRLYEEISLCPDKFGFDLK